jgi:hypothetical protein
MRLGLVAVIVLPLLAWSAPPMNFDEWVEPAWAKVEKPSTKAPPPGVMWRFRVAPPLPTEWPMTAKSALVRWVFAAGMEVGLHDGERVAAPWARIDTTADGASKLTVLTKTLDGNDIQGVKPISKAEADLVGGVCQASEALEAGDLALVKPSWCAWLKHNGVIAAKLKPNHQAFFTALACDAK